MSIPKSISPAVAAAPTAHSGPSEPLALRKAPSAPTTAAAETLLTRAPRHKSRPPQQAIDLGRPHAQAVVRYISPEAQRNLVHSTALKAQGNDFPDKA